MTELNPIPQKIQLWAGGIWTLSTIIVLVSNSRKRTIHDFIAGTVVIKSIFVEKIREITQPVTSETEEL